MALLLPGLLFTWENDFNQEKGNNIVSGVSIFMVERSNFTWRRFLIGTVFVVCDSCFVIIYSLV